MPLLLACEATDLDALDSAPLAELGVDSAPVDAGPDASLRDVPSPDAAADAAGDRAPMPDAAPDAAPDGAPALDAAPDAAPDGAPAPDAAPDAAPTPDAAPDAAEPCAELDCDDLNPCTADRCEAGECVHEPVGEACDDEDPCTADDRCVEGACRGTLLDEDGDGVPGPGCGGADCDDADPTRYPGAAEVCNQRDDDCDEEVDEVPAAVDCTAANEIDADGACDPAAGDPTGAYASAQVVDLGQAFQDLRLNYLFDTDAPDCRVAISTSADGQRWQDYAFGVARAGHVLADLPTRFVRAGSDDCGVSGLQVDPVCVCEAPIELNCGQLNELDDGRCCCFQASHVLDLAEEVSDREARCQVATGFNRGCEAQVSIEASSDGVEWRVVDDYAWESVPRPEGGWVRAERAMRIEGAFRYLRIAADACFVDFAACSVDPACSPKYDCEAEGAPVCEDGDPCTLGRCDDRLGCVFEPACPEDGDACTTAICVGGDAPFCDVERRVCDDDELCTVDQCNPETGICEFAERALDNPACDDRDPCTVDLCEVVCEGDLCAPGCRQEPVACPALEDPCQVAVCREGECVGVPRDCADEDPCTIDSCTPGVGCAHTLDTCDDENLCTFDRCEEGRCVNVPRAQVPECDDEDPCTLDRCDAFRGICVHEDGGECEPACQQDADCGDGNGCTEDTCEGGECVFRPMPCGDGDPCNGEERCDPRVGACLPGVPVSCSDGDACNGEEVCDRQTGECVAGEPVDCTPEDACATPARCDSQSGACRPVPEACGLAPPECDQAGGVGGPEGNRTVAGVTTGLRLFEDDDYEARLAAYERLEAHPSTRRVGYADLLADLNRTGKRVAWVPGVECFSLGFRFNDGDNAVDYWWPQGMTGSADTNAQNEVAGHKVAIVSWYHKPHEDPSTETDKGARISFIRTTDIDDPDYRHLLLVEPYIDDAGRPNIRPVSTHAGGIVWFGDLLYVADTSRGFRVFDLSKTLRVSTGFKEVIGYRAVDDAFQAFNYRYVVPLLRRYRRCESSCCARFSFAGLDRSSDPPSIISGGYTAEDRSARLHRWPLDPETGLLRMEAGVARPNEVIYPNAIRMQGALSVGRTWYISSSEPKLSFVPAAGTLYVTRIGQVPEERGYSLLPEDLHYSPQSGRLWTVSELPRHRYVYSVRTDCD